MARSAKRKKRVLILVGGSVALVAAAGGAYMFRQYRMNRYDREQYALGLAAFEQKDYPKAVDGLGRYLRRLGDKSGTAEDFHTYARALRHVPMPKGAHLLSAIGALRRAVELDPQSRAVQDDLLELYARVGYTAEALDLADRMLASTPGDAKVLGMKADLLEVLRQFPKAQEAADRVCELAPADIGAHLRSLRLRLLQGAAAESVDAWIDAVLATHGADSRFELLRATVLLSRQDVQRASPILDRVLASTPAVDDVSFLLTLVAQLDAMGRFADSLQVLQRIEDGADLPMRLELARRLWYAGRAADVVTRTEPWVRDVSAADAELLVIRAMALRVGGRKDEAEALRTAIASREDATAVAWAAFLDTALGRTTEASAVRVALADAAKSQPGSALIRQSLGDAMAAQRERQAALQAWQSAAALAPSWSRPHMSMARHYLTTLDPQAAGLAARAALARAPNDVGAIVVWIQANGSAAQNLTPEQTAQLIQSAASVREQVPATADAILPVEIGLLARSDKAAAAQRLEGILGATERPSEATILQLSGVARAADIPFESRLFDLCESVHGVTPNLALARAMAEARDATADSGIRRFDEMRGRAAAGTTAADWGLARAAVLEALGRSESGAAWITLADAQPDDLRAQLGTLASAGAWADRDGIARAIGRVRTLTGESGLTWRTADARWKISDPAATETTLAEATKTLADVTREAPGDLQARLLLAEGFERLGNLPSAEEQLRVASDLDPDNARIALQRAGLAQRQGRTEDARRQLDRALAAGNLAPPLAEQAAFLLATQGDTRRSLSVLEPLSSSGRSRAGVLLLAQMHARMGQADRALELCKQLMDRPTPDVVQLAADLHATLGQRAEGEAMLARMDSMGFQAGDPQLVRARYALRWGTPAAASESFLAATLAAPGREDVWVAYLRHVVTLGDTAALSLIVDDPRAATFDSVAFVAANRAIVASAVGDTLLRPAILDALDKGANRTLLLDAVKVARDARESPAKTEDAARRLIRMADENVRVLPLQALAVDMCVRVGDLRKAVEVARRAATEFPNSATAARLSAEMLAASSRWSEALDAGRIWAERTGTDLRPQMFVASMLLRLGRANEAVEALAPHAQVALARPDENRDVLVTWVVALARAGKVSAAAEQMRGLASRSAVWRTLPLTVGPDWMGDAEGAVAWLRACAANVPDDDVKARLQLAKAWGAAWESFRSPELLAAAHEVLGKLTASPDASAETFFLAGVLSQQVGDVEAAKSGYRTALARDPKFVAAQNNLAMILADHGGWEEAVTHAQAVLAAHPGNPEFLDTLAYCLRKGRKFDEARVRLEEAILAQPGNPTWRVSLAEVLAESGDKAEFMRTMGRIDEMATAGAGLGPELTARVAKLRERR